MATGDFYEFERFRAEMSFIKDTYTGYPVTEDKWFRHYTEPTPSPIVNQIIGTLLIITPIYFIGKAVLEYLGGW